MKTYRHGYSLLEVMVAAAVLFGSAAVLTQLAGVGRKHLQRATDWATAQSLCQNKLNELLAGIAPLEASEFAPFFEEPTWSFSVEVQPVGFSNLAEITVEVGRTSNVENRTRQDNALDRVYRLVRWIRVAGPSDGFTSDERRFVRHEFTAERELAIPSLSSP